MTNPDNRAWRDGLLQYIELSRRQLLELLPEQSVHYLIYQQTGKTTNQNLLNLKYVQQVVPGGEPFRVPWGGKHVCIAVDTGQRQTDLELKLYSRQHIQGNIQITVDYQVRHPLKAASRLDVLTDLQKMFQDAVQGVAGKLAYNSVTLPQLRSALQAVNATRLGLSISEIILPHPIFWDSAVAKPSTSIAEAEARAIQLQNISMIRMQTDRQRRLMVEQELAHYGISDVETISEITAALNPDDPNIAKAIKQVLDERRIRSEKGAAVDHEILKDLDEGNRLTRQDYEDLAEGAINRINLQQSEQQETSRPVLGKKSQGRQSQHRNDNPGLPSGQAGYTRLPAPSRPASDVNQPSHLPEGLPDPNEETSRQPAARKSRPLISYGQPSPNPTHAILHDLTDHNGEFVLFSPETRIGRRADNHIVIADQRVSRRHCLIEFRRDGNFYLHKISDKPTFLNGEDIGDQSVMLREGSELIIGDARFQFWLKRPPHNMSQGYAPYDDGGETRLP